MSVAAHAFGVTRSCQKGWETRKVHGSRSGLKGRSSGNDCRVLHSQAHNDSEAKYFSKTRLKLRFLADIGA
jgi:hypothetical protein